MSRRSNGESVLEGSTTVRATSAGISACAFSDVIASSQVPWPAMSVCIQRWTRAKSGLVPIRGNLFQLRRGDQLFFLFTEAARLQRFAVHHVEGGNVRIPFEQRRRAAQLAMGVAIQVPDFVDHVIAVR